MHRCMASLQAQYIESKNTEDQARAGYTGYHDHASAALLMFLFSCGAALANPVGKIAGSGIKESIKDLPHRSSKVMNV